MTSESFASRLRDALSRGPGSAWVRRDLALIGWGESLRLDPGTGADRFDRSMRDLRAAGASHGFASFTFDEGSLGSIVVVPEVMIRIEPQATTFLIGAPDEIPPPVPKSSLPVGRLSEPDPRAWVAGVEKALAVIGAGELEKVVLSRVVTVDHDEIVAPHLVLANLAVAEPDAHTFLIDDFVGSSPELLVSLRSGKARSISLAGSADLDDPAGVHTFDTEKMIREHTLAADSVGEALAPFCLALERSPSRVATYGEIRHLSTTFEGDTHAGTQVTDLLSALHPTAAVAGTPTKAALELIRELESHERGRYAGPVGWLEASGDGEFAIALRCGQFNGPRLTLHSGAGIVRGSDPGLEYEETNIKLRPMLGALGLS